MVWSDRERMVAVMAVIICGATMSVHAQMIPTSGVFRLGKSCHPLSTGAAVEERTDFSIERPLWIRTNLPVTLEAKDKNQSCYLTENTVYKGSHEGWVEIANAMRADVDGCIFQSNTVLRLQEGYVQVSCNLNLVEAENEMKDGLPKSDSTQALLEPRLLNFDAAPTSDNPEVDDATTLHTSNESGVEILAFSTKPRPVTDGSGDDQTSNSPMIIVSTTGPLLALLSTGSETEAANVPESPIIETEATTIGTEATTIGTEATTIATEATTIGTEATTIGTEATMTATEATTDGPKKAASVSTTTEDSHPTTVLPTRPRLQNIQSSPATNDSGHHILNKDHVPYFIGAGGCVLGLTIGIACIICLVKRRAPKPRRTENNELFFIPGSYSGTLERLNSDSVDSQDRHKRGSYNNAQVMYSGAEPEYAESFDLEDKILRSQQSSSSEGPEVPKCLRKD